MADNQLQEVSRSLNIFNNLENNEELKCQYCDMLKKDLQEAKQDILSYREIIKILLEEQSNTQQQQLRTEEPCREELFHTTSRNTSMKITLRAGIRPSNLIQVIPTANKFEILSKVNDSNEATCSTSTSIINNATSRKFKKNSQKKTQQSLQTTQGKKKLERKRQRILLLGDSHARKCATNLQHNLGDDYEVSSFVKPGARMEGILNPTSENVKSLSDNDVLIVWGGSNDISRNNTKEAINQLCKFIKEKSTVNLVIMKAPQRHDLISSSCVNNEVSKFNRLIEKRVKPYTNAKLFDLDLDRSHYTTHGQHLNSAGKEFITNKLAILIKDVFAKKQLTPIQIPWKELLEEPNQSHKTSGNLTLNVETSKQPSQIDIGTIEIPEQKNLMGTITQSDPPKRQRKQIALKNTDFLWT